MRQQAPPQFRGRGEGEISHPAEYTDRSVWHDRRMLAALRAMPNGVRLFVAYAVVVLALIGLALPDIVGLAVEAPVTGPGLVAMLLLAYTIFTMTLVLQRKRAAYWLAVGLSSLTVPLVVALWLLGAMAAALMAAAIAVGLFVGLSRPSSRGYFTDE